MKHSNISIFVSHEGCPNKCAFCNQHTINGCLSLPTSDEVKEICSKAMVEVKDKKNCEIAFFGGSFTAIERNYMLSLLTTAKEFVGENAFKGIRISTRPDCITPEILEILKENKVTAIELGAQSMDNEVLSANDRGHTAEDVVYASKLIKSYGFELGLQMMTGLYKSTIKKDYETAEKIVKLCPETVRIYPTVVLENTKLSSLFKTGDYTLCDFDDMVSLCGEILLLFEKSHIRVIRCGLHSSDKVEGEAVAGFYHPAFKELCEGRIYRNKISEIIKNNPCQNFYEIIVNQNCISKALGHKKENVEFFKNLGFNIKIIGDKNTLKYKCELRR